MTMAEQQQTWQREGQAETVLEEVFSDDLQAISGIVKQLRSRDPVLGT